MHILHTVLYTFLWLPYKENISNNSEILEFVIISFILVTLKLDSRVILLRETRCLSLPGINLRGNSYLSLEFSKRGPFIVLTADISFTVWEFLHCHI